MRPENVTFALALALALPAVAQEPEALPAPLPTPPAVVTAITARVFVDGPLMKVDQAIEITNTADVAQDFELAFPLGRSGGGAALISGLSARVDGRDLEGELFSTEQANALFRQMARDGRDPTLLEHYGEGLYRARVAALAPGSTRTVNVRYSRLVDTQGENLRLHLPLTAFRRSAGPVKLVIEGEIRSLRPASALYSPTHDVVEGRPFVSYEDTTPYQHQPFRVEQAAALCDTDFEAFYKTRADGALFDVTVLSERPDASEDGYFLAVIHGAPDETLVPEAKNVVFVIDRSGSMKEDKIVQAREALAFLVSKLRPEDRFNIVSYSTDVTAFAEHLQAPTAATLARAQRFVEAIQADSGTNISQALAAALAQFEDTSLLNQVVFLTDGLPTEGEVDSSRLCALVKEANKHAARLVAFGLGFDVNGMLLDRLAEENRGMSEYVLPDQDIDERVPGFYARMQLPLLLDTALAFEGTQVHDLFPRAIGDLYGGHKLVVTGRYSQAGRAKLVITGRRGTEDQRHEFAFDLAADTSRAGRDLVARIWAAKQIGFLVDEIRLAGETPERVAAIVRLGTRFGILTEYTAFLAEEATDLFAVGKNTETCSGEIKKYAGVATGTHGVAQACNSKLLQRGDQAIGCNSWVGANGETVTIGNVQCIAGKTFFRKAGTWRQSDLPSDAAVEELALYSDEFFTLLEANPWLGACVARTGDVTLAIAGKNVRVKG